MADSNYYAQFDSPTSTAPQGPPPADVPQAGNYYAQFDTKDLGGSKTENAEASFINELTNLGTGTKQYLYRLLANSPFDPTANFGLPGTPPSLFTKKLEQSQAEVTANRPQEAQLSAQSGSTYGKVGANVVGSLPFMAFGGPVGSTVGGGLFGALQPTGTGESQWGNVAEGAAGGLAGYGVATKVIGPIAGKIMDLLKSGSGAIKSVADEAGLSLDPYGQSKKALDVVNAWVQDAKNVASGTYDAAASATGADSPFPLAPFMEKAGPILQDYADFIPNAIKQRIQQFQNANIIGTPGSAELSQADMAAAKPMTVGEASKLYKLINNLTGGASDAAAIAGTELKKALAYAGDQLPTDVPAFKLFQDATQQWRNIYQQTAAPPIKTLANVGNTQARMGPQAADVSPEFLQRLWSSGKPAEISALHNFLQTAEPGSEQVMHDSLLTTLFNKAGGESNFSGPALLKAMQSMGTARMSTVLSPEEMQNLSRIAMGSGTLGGMAKLAPWLGMIGGHFVEPLIEHLLPVPGAGAIGGYLAGETMKDISKNRSAAAAQQLLQLISPDLAQQVLPSLTNQLGGAVGASMGSGGFLGAGR